MKYPVLGVALGCLLACGTDNKSDAPWTPAGDQNTPSGDDTEPTTDDPTLPDPDDDPPGPDDPVTDPIDDPTQEPTPSTVRVYFDVGFGNQITLRGSGAGLNWDSGSACTWTEGNIWQCPLGVLAADVEIKPLFNDEVWAPGTNHVVNKGSDLDLYPHFFAGTGSVTLWEDIYSPELDNSRNVAIYLPPSYNENPLKRYPVVFMHDGQNMFDANTASFGYEWYVDEALNDLVTLGGIVEAIVIAPYNSVDRINEYTPTSDGDYGGGDADLYLDFLIDTLLPQVDNAFRTATDARVGIAGSSLGGLVSMYACWTRPELFDRCGVFSPSLWWDDGYMLDLVAYDDAPPMDLRIYIDSGDSGVSQDGMDDVITMRDLLVEHGYVLGENLQYVLGEGHSHNEAAWAARSPGAFNYLLQDSQRMVWNP